MIILKDETELKLKKSQKNNQAWLFFAKETA